MSEEALHFIAWENECFGAGYGTGELPILESIKTFFSLLKDGRSYDYEALENGLGKAVTWLIINALYKANTIEWGTSSRHGWLTPCGKRLKEYFDKKSADELYEILFSHEPPCQCKGSLEGHEECGENPFLKN